MSDSDDLADQVELWSPESQPVRPDAHFPPQHRAKRLRLFRDQAPRRVPRGSPLPFSGLQLYAEEAAGPATPPDQLQPIQNAAISQPVASTPNPDASQRAAELEHLQQPVALDASELAEWSADFEEQASRSQPGSSETVTRAESTQQAWKSRRLELEGLEIRTHACPAQALHCQCQQPAVVVCMDCPDNGTTALCADCDLQHHPHAHFHRRQHFCNQFWESVPPACNVDAQGQLQAAGRGFDSCISLCACGSCNWVNPVPDQGSFGRIIYVFQGRHEFCRYVYTCAACGAHHRQTSADLQAVGAWPGTPDAVRCVVFIDQRTFEDFRSFKFNNPQGSMQAFLGMLADMTERWGSQAPRLDNHMFIQSYLEWLRMEHSLRQGCMLVQDLQCPACYPSPHSIHIDANMKLSVWKRHNAARLERTLPDVLLDDSDHVLDFMAALDEASGREPQDRDCRVIWQAAGDKTYRYDKMAVSGRCFGTCRHVVPMKAVNLVGTGERYAYAMFLLVHHFYAMAPSFVFQDIACKHSGWRSRLQQRILAMSEEDRQAKPAYQAVILAMAHAALTTDVLPDMHGCLHAWSCQVQFGAGWKVGVAGGSGEDCEQFFSFASRLAYAQRNMGVARSDDFLTSACLSWAIQKRRKLAELLAIRYKTTLVKAKDAEAQLRELCSQHLPETSDLGASQIPQFHAALEQLASEIVEAKQKRRAGHAIEYFKLHQRIAGAESLQAFVDGGDLARRIVAADNEDLIMMHQTAAQLLDKTDALKASQEQARLKMIAEQPELASLDPEELASKSYQDLAERHILQLQDQLEAQVAMLRRHRQKLLQEAATPKERDRFNKKIRADNKSIEATLKQYNELVPWGLQTRTAAEIAALVSVPPQFPWADEVASGSLAALRPHGVYVSFGLCDASNRMRRCREEISLLQKEMRQYIAFFSDALAEIDTKITTLANDPAPSSQACGRLALLHKSAHLQRNLMAEGHGKFGAISTIESYSHALTSSNSLPLVPSADDVV